MSNPAHVPAILQEPRRHRYLKLIALFKIAKGVLLLLLGVSLVFLNARTRWMDALSNWTADEILLEHSKVIHYLLNKLQAVLQGGVFAPPVFWRSPMRQFFLPKESASICSSGGRSC